jgi:hypothetical protein
MTRSILAWLAALAVTVVLTGLVRLGAAVPAGGSDPQAWQTVHRLAETIGHRHPGSPGYDASVAYLKTRLAAIPGVETAIQTVSGTRLPASGPVIAYAVTNVLARLPGTVAGSILVSAHFDTPPESVGAADNGAGVAAALATLERLAAAPAERRTIVVNLNGGEETGLVGADGFLRHPWSRDVVAFVNLDAAGTAGRPLAFRVAGDQVAMAGALAGSASAEVSGFAQDVFATGLVPSETDFDVYATGHGLPGLDIALYRDGYAYHTGNDRLSRLHPPTVTALAEAALTATRHLAAPRTVLTRHHRQAAFWSLPGGQVIRYGRPAAVSVALLAAALATWAIWRRQVPPGQVVRRAVRLLAAMAGGVAVPAALGFLFDATGMGHRWYAHPLPAIAGYALLAVATMALAWPAADDAHHPVVDQAAAMTLWTVTAMALAAFGLSSSYLPLTWALGGTLALAKLGTSPLVGRCLGALGWLPAAWLTLGAGDMLLSMMIPAAGRLGPSVGVDGPLAAVVALIGVTLAAAGLPLLGSHGRRRPAASILAIVGLAGPLIGAQQSPYSPESPKRLAVSTARDDAGTWQRRVHTEDPVDLTPTLTALLGVAPVPGRAHAWAGPARPSAKAIPSVTVAARADGIRLTVLPHGYGQLVLRLPREAVTGWSLAPAWPQGRSPFVSLLVVNPPATGWAIDLHVKQAGKASLTGYAEQPADGPDARDLRRLPDWVTAFGYRQIEVAVDLPPPSARPRLRQGP